jgi:signal recognition particle receptor subunit beta
VAHLHPKRREWVARVLYWGPGLSGKTTSVRWLHEHAPPERAGALLRLACDSQQQPASFDFLPLCLGELHGVSLRLYVYTTPGHVQRDGTRRSLLQHADGIVFVADSHPDRQEANAVALTELQEGLQERARGAAVPWVLVCNKQDLPEAVPAAHIGRALGQTEARTHPAQARTGSGLLAPLLALLEDMVSAEGPR